DTQADRESHYYRNLNTLTGRCGIHERRPFSCDFELIRFIHMQDKVVLTQKLFGRGWAMLRVDGRRGAKCEMLAPNKQGVSEVARKLSRLQNWAGYFGVVTCLDRILEWVNTGPHSHSLSIPV